MKETYHIDENSKVDILWPVTIIYLVIVTLAFVALTYAVYKHSVYNIKWLRGWLKNRKDT